MNSLHNLPCSAVLPLPGFICNRRHLNLSAATSLGMMGSNADRRRTVALKASSGSTPSAETSVAEVDEEKSEIYSHTMTEAMGAVLTYRHELGMNYNFIRPDVIVGSCLQTPEDVDKLRSIGVKTIFCLQQNSDLEYFSVDIGVIQEYAKEADNIEHLRAEIRDFDSYDLRLRLPAVVSKLYKAINRNAGVSYIHCTAGLGRAPSTALAYMFWVQGYKLNDAVNLLLSKRPCFPKLDAIKNATADILTGMKKKAVTLTWGADGCSTVEISGLDIGWGQRKPLKFDDKLNSWILERELPEGRYEYKYVVDGEWVINKNEHVTSPNKDGHVNNYVEIVEDDANSPNAITRKRLTGEDPDLTTDERLKIRHGIRTGMKKKAVTLTWSADGCSTVEISGLDIGWGQRKPLKFDDKLNSWILERELLEGRYEYKYVVDGEWVINKNEHVTSPNKDGHVNNYVEIVEDDANSPNAITRKRLTGEDPDLTTDERLKIRQFLEAYPTDE